MLKVLLLRCRCGLVVGWGCCVSDGNMAVIIPAGMPLICTGSNLVWTGLHLVLLAIYCGLHNNGDSGHPANPLTALCVSAFQS